MNRLLFGVVTVGALLACQGEPVGPSTVGGLTLSLALSSAQLRRGEIDTIVLTITNRNRRAVSLSAGGCPLLVSVTDARGTTVVPSGGVWVCPAVITQITLAAGARETRSYVWATDSFESGPYTVVGTFAAQGVRLSTSRASVQLN